MKIALCDDEKIFRDDIYRYIIKYNPDYEIREFPNGRALLNSREEFDIIFLDIEMPELNGMDTAAKLRNFSSDSIIIFLTSHIEKVQDAFKVRAFRFLTKPVQEDALKEAFTQAVKEISEQEKILINQKGRISEVKIDDIVYIEAFGDGTYIYDAKDNVYECTVQLKEWDSRLSGKNFFKIHKSYIISMRYVTGFTGNHLTLNGVPSEFTVSRRNVTSFKEAYLNFVKNNSHIV